MRLLLLLVVELGGEILLVESIINRRGLPMLRALFERLC